MPLAQACAGDRVLGGREDPVAHVLVTRHSPAECATGIEHPRAEHRVGVAVDDRRQQVGHLLRGVLAIAVQEHDDIPPVIDGVAVSGLLVAAVAEIVIVADDRERNVRARGHVPVSDIEGRVRRVIVHDEHLGKFDPQIGRNPVENPPQRRFSVVGDDEHPDLHVTPPGCTRIRVTLQSRRHLGRPLYSDRPVSSDTPSNGTPTLLERQQLNIQDPSAHTFWHWVRFDLVAETANAQHAVQVLDIGAGSGMLGDWMATNVPGVRYRFEELSPVLDAALATHFGSEARHDPAETISADTVVTMLDVVEHIEDDLGVLTELATVWIRARHSCSRFRRCNGRSPRGTSNSATTAAIRGARSAPCSNVPGSRCAARRTCSRRCW